MRIEGRKYRDEWLPNYYPARRIGDLYMRLSRTGRTQVLNAEENRQIDEIYMSEELFERLEHSGHIITRGNATRVLQDLELWHQKTFCGPELHIVVLTKRCNLNCSYCHMNPEAINADKSRFDLKPEVAEKVIRFALQSPNPRINFEFQGGEPFLNFPAMVHFVEEARKQNRNLGKDIDFCAVTNLMLVNDEHMRFCADNDINVSFSLNGPQALHDYFRKSRSGAGSFDVVTRKLDYLQGKFSGTLSTSPLCVVGADNEAHLPQMLDFFHDRDFNGVAILKLKPLGNARREELAFDVRAFLRCYLQGLDHIYYKNQALDQVFSERSLRVVLSKILSPTDIGFVDWRNPCGDFGSAITYDYDGEILPSDEARSMRHEWSLGNVMNTTYEDLLGKEQTFRSMNLSLRDRDSECRECAFNPFCGVAPVLDYARTGDPVPRPHQSDECLFTIAVLDWTFTKLMEDPLPLVRMLPNIDSHLAELVN